MPPQIKRDCQVILYDLNTNSQQSTKCCLLKYYCRKLFTNSKNLYKLILINSKTTKNRLNARYTNRYLGINEIMNDPKLYTEPKWLEETIDKAESGQSNLLEALYVGYKSLSEDFVGQGNLISLQLIVLSDLSNLVLSDNNDLFEKMMGELKQSRIFLYIIGPNAQPSFIIKDLFMINNWMKDLRITSTSQSQSNFEIVSKLVANFERSICCNYQIGLNLLECFKQFAGRQPWMVPLCIGDNMKFVCATRRVLQRGMLCKIVKKRREFKRTVWVDIEDTSINYANEEIISGFERHGKFVPIVDKQRFKETTEREFTIYGFFKRTEIPEHYLKGDGSYYVLPHGTDKRPMQLFIDCMLHRDMVIIARRVYNRNYNPKYVCLLPKVEPCRCFILCDVPYNHQVGHIPYRELLPPLKDSQCYKNFGKNDLVYNFLDSISCKRGEVIEKIPLNINFIQHPKCEMIINKAADKLFGKHLHFEHFDLNYSNINIADNSDCLDELKEIWPVRELERKAKRQQATSDVDEDEDDFHFA